MRFEGKSVIVTGASSGMGRQMAYDFAKEGATVVAVARRQERLEELANQVEADELPGTILPYPGDATSEEVNDGMVAFAAEQCGRLDVLVNNAGIMDGMEPVGELTDERWEKVMAINLDGPMYAMRAAVKQFQAQEPNEDGSRGNIVNVASIGGVAGARAGAAYVASKHAIIGLTQNTGYMYANDGIHCNAVCPGGVATEISGTMTNMSQFGAGRVMAGYDRTIRLADPEELAAAVLFVASDEASFMTGSVMVVDGGVTAN